MKEKMRLNPIVLCEIFSTFFFMLFLAMFIVIGVNARGDLKLFFYADFLGKNFSNIRKFIDFKATEGGYFTDKPWGYDWIKDSEGNPILINGRYLPLGGILAIISWCFLIYGLFAMYLGVKKFLSNKKYFILWSCSLNVFTFIPFAVITLAFPTYISLIDKNKLLILVSILSILLFVFFSIYSLFASLKDSPVAQDIVEELIDDVSDNHPFEEKNEEKIDDIILPEISVTEDKANIIPTFDEDKLRTIVRDVVREEIAKAKTKPVIVQYFAGTKVKNEGEFTLKEKNLENDEGLCEDDTDSYSNRLLELNNPMKDFYSQIKERILTYGLEARITKSGEDFILDGKTYISIRCLTFLKLYFALNPSSYKNTKIPVMDVGEISKYEETPLCFRVRNSLGMKRAFLLIDDCLKDLKENSD